jgi:predicted dehydrogenase
MKQRVILIGHGGISKSYVSAFSKNEKADIFGVVGRDNKRVKEFAWKNDIQIFGTDVKEVNERAKATAAVICTPNANHYEGVLTASQLGLHCLCEKPLHISVEKQQEMIYSCQEHNVKLAVSYMRRFIPHLRFIKELIDSGKLGRITVVDVMIKHFRDKKYYESWHGTNEIDGGGPFMQQGSHIIDLALWLCGGFKEVIDSKRFQVYHEIETEDHGYAIVHYNNGAIGMIEASTASIGLKKEGIEISGTNGTICANYQEITTFDVPGLTLPEFNDEATNEVLFEQLVSDFIESIEKDRSPFIDGESAKKATELIAEIYSKAGEPIKLIPGKQEM